MDDLNTRIISTYILYKRHQKKKNKKKKLWIHPILENRKEKGAFANLVKELQDDDTKFFNYYRMSKSSYKELLGRLENVLQRSDTKFREALTPNEQLTITIR